MAFAFLANLTQAAELGVQTPVGGWSAAGLQDEPVLKAARFALQEQSRQSQSTFKLLAIKHARQQLVAGIHYSMNLMVQSEGKKRLVIAVVWTRPDGSMELTRWHWV
jgi:Aspartic acid proteinase inhibitor